MFWVAGSASLHSTTSLPTSQELAEIFGNSDDEDDDFPFPPLSGALTGGVGGTLSAVVPLQEPQPAQSSESLFSSLMASPEPLFRHGGLSGPLTVPSAIPTTTAIPEENDINSDTGKIRF